MVRVLVLVIGLVVVLALAYLIGRSAYEDYATEGVGYIQASTLPGPKGMDIVAKKRAFFAFLRPIVEAENRRIERLRRHLIAARKAGLAPHWVRAAAQAYGVTWAGQEWDQLLRRVDTVPPALALAQAANETSWGRSRFAQQGNNLFGQWCFRPGCGIVPKKRPPGKIYEVAAYDTVNASVRAYLHNLNTSPAYRLLRELRHRARRQGKEATAHQLAGGLDRYSARGPAYVAEIRAMIRANRDLMRAANGGS